MEAIPTRLLEYGALGIMVLSAGVIIGILWKSYLNLQQQLKTLNEQYQEQLKSLNDKYTQRYDDLVKYYESQYMDLFGRYGQLVKELVGQQNSLENTLERLQEGLAAKDLLTDYISELRKDRG